MANQRAFAAEMHGKHTGLLERSFDCRLGGSSQGKERAMAYDEGLATRVRDVLGDRGGLAEKKMFGGSPSCCTATWPAGCAATT